MDVQPIQNFYNAKAAICYGCGRNNAHGLHIQTYWDGVEGTCHFMPQAYHTAFPGVIYGGLIASIIDCHSIGTAIAAMYDSEGRTPDSAPEITCVTGQLNISYLKPTPAQTELLLRASIKELHPRKAIVTCSVFAQGTETVRAEVVAVRVQSRLMMLNPSEPE
jgi:acyl-coenzyme A thioesterase PaaI-like protein